MAENQTESPDDVETPKPEEFNSGKFGEWVVLRCFGAGVHCGIIQERKGPWEYVLSQSRRIWRWRSGDGPKIYSCSELARFGPDPETSSVTTGVRGQVISTVCEVIPMTDAAIERLLRCRFTGL